jgi:hypothetical protein
LLHQVGDLFELNVKLGCQKDKSGYQQLKSMSRMGEKENKRPTEQDAYAKVMDRK